MMEHGLLDSKLYGRIERVDVDLGRRKKVASNRTQACDSNFVEECGKATALQSFSEMTHPELRIHISWCELAQVG